MTTTQTLQSTKVQTQRRYDYIYGENVARIFIDQDKELRIKMIKKPFKKINKLDHWILY